MRLTVLTLALGLILSACADPAPPAAPASPAPEAPTPEPAGAPQEPVIGMANPASVHCGEVGGRLEIRDGEGGQYGVCIFEDGRQCEEWALFRDNRCVSAPQAPASGTAGAETEG